MADLSPDFQRTLDQLLERLGVRLGLGPIRARLDAQAHRPALRNGILAVPVPFEVHWRRFHTVPTDLVRDAAYEACRATKKGDEADCVAFSEVFVRDHVLEAP